MLVRRDPRAAVPSISPVANYTPCMQTTSRFGKTVLKCDVSIRYSVTYYTKMVSIKTQTPHRNNDSIIEFVCVLTDISPGH